jgi:hypothetical protein
MRDNAQALAAAGVLYPEIGRATDAIAHHVLAKGLKRRRDIPAEVEAMWREIAALAANAPNVLVSSEGLEPGPGPLGEWLAGVPVKVIAYVRDLPSRLVSIYAQSTKRGQGSLDFDAFVEREFKLERTYTAPKLKGWADAFGAENVRIRSVHPACLSGGEVISDFLAAIGLGADARERLGLVGGGLQNVSPGWRTLEILRELNAGAEWLDEETSGTYDPRSPAGTLLRAALDAEAKLGWSERGLYLDQAQIERAVRIDREDVAAVEALAVDACLEPAAPDAIAPRTFLPEISRIPSEEVTAFYREMVIATARQAMLRPQRMRARRGS